MYCNAAYVKSDVEIVPGKYSNGRLAIKLIDTLDDSPAANATVNISEADLADDEIIIKDWSENEGMLEFFVENGLAEDTGKTIPMGFVVANIVKVTDKLKSICGIG